MVRKRPLYVYSKGVPALYHFGSGVTVLLEIHERLQQLRGELGLTTRSFGAGIHLSGSAISNMENGLRSITRRTVGDICRQYHVNPGWLLEGAGEMFADPTDGLDLSEEVRHLAAQYSRLGDSDRELIRRLIDSLAEKLK